MCLCGVSFVCLHPLKYVSLMLFASMNMLHFVLTVTLLLSQLGSVSPCTSVFTDEGEIVNFDCTSDELCLADVQGYLLDVPCSRQVWREADCDDFELAASPACNLTEPNCFYLNQNGTIYTAPCNSTEQVCTTTDGNLTVFAPCTNSSAFCYNCPAGTFSGKGMKYPSWLVYRAD